MNTRLLTRILEAASPWTPTLIGAALAWGIGLRLHVPFVRDIPTEYAAYFMGAGGLVAIVFAHFELGDPKRSARHRGRGGVEDLCDLVGRCILSWPAWGAVFALVATMVVRLASRFSGAHTLRAASALVSNSLFFDLCVVAIGLLLLPGVLVLTLFFIDAAVGHFHGSAAAGLAESPKA